MITTTPNEFVTADTQCAAFLVAMGQRPQRVEGPGYRQCFVFDGTVASLAAEYFRDSRLVSPQALFRAYRELKRLLHERRTA